MSEPDEKAAAPDEKVVRQVPKKRIFPSAEAAFVTGCLMPSMAIRLAQLLSQGTGDLWLFVFMLGGVGLPLLVSVVDLETLRRSGAFPFLRVYRFPLWEEMLEDLIPTWGRMAAWLLGAALSAFVQYGFHLRP